MELLPFVARPETETEKKLAVFIKVVCAGERDPHITLGDDSMHGWVRVPDAQLELNHEVECKQCTHRFRIAREYARECFRLRTRRLTATFWGYARAALAWRRVACRARVRVAERRYAPLAPGYAAAKEEFECSSESLAGVKRPRAESLAGALARTAVETVCSGMVVLRGLPLETQQALCDAVDLPACAFAADNEKTRGVTMMHLGVHAVGGQFKVAIAQL